MNALRMFVSAKAVGSAMAAGGFFLAAFLSGAVSTADAAPPPGSYTTHYTLPKPNDCIPAGKRGFTEPVCKNSEVGRVSIIEESTSEILADCEFGDANYVTTKPKPGESYSCERKRDPATGKTDVWVYSQQANLPIVHVYHLMEGGGIWDESVASAVDKVVRGPDGRAYADPYTRQELKFAGHKQFFLVAKKGGIKSVQKVVSSLKSAGYDAVMRRFEGGVGEVSVYGTFDGRALIEARILKKAGWAPRKDRASTRGNKGTYDETRYKFAGAEKVGNYDVTVKGESEAGLYGNWKVSWSAVSITEGAKSEITISEDVVTSDEPGSPGELKGAGKAIQTIAWEDMQGKHEGTVNVKGTATIGGSAESPTITLTWTEFNMDMTGRGTAGGEAYGIRSQTSGNQADGARSTVTSRTHQSTRNSPFVQKPKTYPVERIQ